MNEHVPNQSTAPILAHQFTVNNTIPRGFSSCALNMFIWKQNNTTNKNKRVHVTVFSYYIYDLPMVRHEACCTFGRMLSRIRIRK